MCELLILKLDVFSNDSDFSSIVWRWIHSLFNEKESSLEPQNSKNQNTFPSWFLVRKNSWRIPAGFSKFSTEIFDRDFRPYRIQPKCKGNQKVLNLRCKNHRQLIGKCLVCQNLAVFSCRGEGKRGAKEKKKRREKEKKEERGECVKREEEEKGNREEEGGVA